MKYSVTGLQPHSIIKKADEILLKYNLGNQLYTLADIFPDKKYVIRIPKDIEEIDFNFFLGFKDKIDFIFCLEDLTHYKECIENKIKFYWAFPIVTWDELDSILELGACEVLLGAPLYFDLEKVKNRISGRAKIRLIANYCFDDSIPRRNGIRGTYVRPEDVILYEKYVDTLEFRVDMLNKEATLLKIYKEDKMWNDDLNILLVNFKYFVNNSGIPDDFGKARLNCGHRCYTRGTCHLCNRILRFVNSVTADPNFTREDLEDE